MKQPFVLRSERVLLRDWRDSDLPPFARLNADPTARRYFVSIRTREESDLEASRIRAAITRDGFGYWALEIPGITEFAGFVGIARTPFTSHFTPCVEIGWRLMPENWGNGYATAAAKLALHHGFLALGLDEIVSFTAAANLPSRGVMERLGMASAESDNFDHPNIPAGHALQRHVLYRIQRERYLTAQTQSPTNDIQSPDSLAGHHNSAARLSTDHPDGIAAPAPGMSRLTAVPPRPFPRRFA